MPKPGVSPSGGKRDGNKRKRDGGEVDKGGKDKRKKYSDAAEDGGAPQEKATIGMLTSNIKNKLVRSELYQKLKHKQKKKKKAERAKRSKVEEAAVAQGLEPPPRKLQKTIENQRVKDETMVQEGDEEVMADEQQDEFADHFDTSRPPKVLITTCFKPTKIMYTFISEVLELLPYAEYYKRQGYPLKKIIKFASNRDYTDVIVFNEDHKEINGMLVCHLPDGPTARFRLSSLVLGKDIKGHGRASHHKPELVLNNFGTRLGRRVGRLFASLFAQDPQFRGRRVVTFHNQRDFIFVRHHRYIFEEKDKKLAPVPGSKEKKPKTERAVGARLQELGPRFTLKLESLQSGTFDSKGGEFEWLRNKDQDTSRRKFYL